MQRDAAEVYGLKESSIVRKGGGRVEGGERGGAAARGGRENARNAALRVTRRRRARDVSPKPLVDEVS